MSSAEQKRTSMRDTHPADRTVARSDQSRRQLLDRIVCLSDLIAAMADAGVDLPDTCAEDGGEQSAASGRIQGVPEVRKDIVHQSIDGSLSIRRGQYKLELCPGSGGWSDPLPGKEDPTAPRFQLYDLSMDISERRNVIEDHLELASELKRSSERLY